MFAVANCLLQFPQSRIVLSKWRFLLYRVIVVRHRTDIQFGTSQDHSTCTESAVDKTTFFFFFFCPFRLFSQSLGTSMDFMQRNPHTLTANKAAIIWSFDALVLDVCSVCTTDDTPPTDRRKGSRLSWIVNKEAKKDQSARKINKIKTVRGQLRLAVALVLFARRSPLSLPLASPRFPT